MTNTRRECAIALCPVEITNQQLMEILSTVRADMSTIKGQIGNVEQTLTNMNGRIGVLATISTNTISVIDSLARAPLAASVRAESTVAAPVVISNHEPTLEESNAVYAHIYNLMWKSKLSLRTPENILANNLKPRWDTNIAFNKSLNREIAKTLLFNLERRFSSSSMRQSDLRKRVARADDNECRRVLAYKNNKEGIDLVMLRDCANTLQKAVLSDGESANEMDKDGIKHVIHIAMESSANQRICRITTSVSNSAVQNNISSNFTQWALRDRL
ncbi:hypothetical protein PHYBLDRAFT_149834 [Phycomyces blakesleeanus NRRL 1555(-)]|uniref:Uncharacterized protein n=1 Tax=Phycomyces blakesleeanus (strain ATCC 8743b / DSM 1359 / FGSC 10004 / NBRC 33097 / NRRL 1555) TaxID=763407 RepID=A0A162NEJ4_PHYB8|nr:hypothetical protein PHYBLDRAFT_149834 [Phycomyces blakesleeanus NRRL 1555(-)]OAD68824.1 hypothetical protein PHYBLDRAFT_149834 [Phycomyces blakesleeanus NRRL 1555(-)]|eukprot:XP_018286864.1 hypothetical protein PHYBLDRAFT_149834 [Phycomyces blakesleeanus NRRL 1555(-)]